MVPVHLTTQHVAAGITNKIKRLLILFTGNSVTSLPKNTNSRLSVFETVTSPYEPSCSSVGRSVFHNFLTGLEITYTFMLLSNNN